MNLARMEQIATTLTTRYHDPGTAAMADVARSLDARAYSGGWVQLLNYDSPEQSTYPQIKNTYTAIADIMPPQRPFIPANSVKVGSIFEVNAWGTITSVAGTATFVLSLMLNGSAGTLLGATAAQTPATTTIFPWHFRAFVTVLTIGAAGTCSASGVAWGLGAATTSAVLLPATGAPISAAIATTATNNITLAGTWSVSNAGNSTSVYGYHVLQLN